MRRSLQLLFATCVLAASTLVVYALDSGSATPTTSATTEFQKLIADTKNEWAKAKSETEKAHKDFETAKSLGQSEALAVTKRALDAAEEKLHSIQQKLTGLERAEAALIEQEPIRLLINELKRQRNAIPNPGTEAQEKLRDALAQQIAALEKAYAELMKQPKPPPEKKTEPEIGGYGITLIVVMLILVVGGVGGGVYVWTKSNANAAQEDDGVARVRLAKLVTLGAMSFIVVVSVVTLLFAGINAVIPPSDEKKVQIFFDIAKWILGAVLPVVAAWVGTVMAFYFGKENFKAGTEHAEKMMKFLSPQEKLESKKASESGMEVSNAAVHSLAAGATLYSVLLSVLGNAFMRNGVTYERLPILDPNGAPMACLHSSTLLRFLLGKPIPNTLTLGDLITGLSWDPAKSITTVQPTDTLTRVQALMKDNKECKDVFVTSDGTRTKPATRWITNDDILKVAEA